MGEYYSLVTGASSGIGKAIAEELAKKKKNLILVARRKVHLDKLSSRLISTYNIKTIVFICDLSEIDAASSIHHFCQTNNLKVDILVNNAGYLMGNEFHKSIEIDEEKGLRVMCNTTVHLTKYFLKDMLQQKTGKIMIVSSIAAFAPPGTKWSLLYAPIKSFLDKFGEALNMLYRKDGISITVVYPGYTVTELQEKGGVQKMMDNVPFYMKQKAEFVARGAVRATLNRRRKYIPGLINKLVIGILKVLPNSVIILISGKISAKRYTD